jgi:hypothetical protein
MTGVNHMGVVEAKCAWMPRYLENGLSLGGQRVSAECEGKGAMLLCPNGRGIWEGA